MVSRLEQVAVHYPAGFLATNIGSPDIEKETGWGDPETRLAVMVLVAEDPWVTDIFIELASEKLKDWLSSW
jgi:hypothetical protein